MRYLLLLLIIPMLVIPQNVYADNYITIDSISATSDTITVVFTTETKVFTDKILVLISTQGGPQYIAEQIRITERGFSDTITTQITAINGEALQENTTYDITIEVKIANAGTVTNPTAYSSITTESGIASESASEPNPESITVQPAKSDDGCFDCVPPTLGYDNEGVKKVDNGVCINDSCMDGGYYHTDYPMQKTLPYFPNTVSTIYYENQGPHNIQLVQLGIGVPDIGSSISESEAIIEVYINYFSNDIYNPSIKEIKLVDPDEIIENYKSAVELVQCMQDDSNLCLKTDFVYSYAKAPSSTILVSNAIDYNRNAINNYFNDGLEVVYYLAPPVEIQEEPKQCIMSSVQNRNNPCQFLPLIEYEKQRALQFLE